MRYVNALIVISIILSLFVGCSNTEKEEAERKRIAEMERIEREKHTAMVRPYPSDPDEGFYYTTYYAEAVSYMNNAQRRGFNEIDPKDQRKRYQYLRRLGIDVMVDQKYLLTEAMYQDSVKPEDVRNIIFKKDTKWVNEYIYLGNEVMLWGGRFNGEGYTTMYFKFIDGKLKDWGAFSDREVEEEGEIKAECARIGEQLGRIISKGESMESIRNKFTYFAEQNNKLLSVYTENALESPDVKGKLTPATWKTEDDKLIRAKVDAFMEPFYLLAEKIPAENKPLGYDLKFKEPEVEHQRDITYWYYYMPFGERTIKYTITFRDRKVKSWRAIPLEKEY